MTNVQEMAQAHLVTVQRTIQDLENQKANIEQELQKLSSYLQEGIEELNGTNASNGEVVEK
jgi:predicted  nucleic acid-binding Zn-ribbon protein